MKKTLITLLISSLLVIGNPTKNMAIANIETKSIFFACNSLLINNNGSSGSCYIKAIFYRDRFNMLVRKMLNLGLGDQAIEYCFKTDQTLTVIVEDQDFFRIFATDGAGNIVSNIRYSTPGVTTYELTINTPWNCEIKLE